VVLVFVLGACGGVETPAAEPWKPSSVPAEAGDTCVVRRAALDIGSATTKVKVAEIDVCERVTLRVLLAEEAPVFYRDDVAGDRPPRFAATTMTRGLAVLNDFHSRAASHAPGAFAAVATSAFRTADNGVDFARRIERELDVPVTIIDQNQEARLGFMAAVRAAGADPQRAVVWDVGGRSMQLSTLRADGQLAVYRGQFASGQMRDFVIRQVQRKDLALLSPNPMSRRDAETAVAHAEGLAREEVPAEIREKIADPATQIVGIGALKYYGDRPAHDGGACARAHLEMTVDGLLAKSDAEIGGPYASTQVSDRLLLVGFMRALGVEQVALADVDLTDGLLFEAEYWRAAADEGHLASAPTR
jgi:exopolyphosphatase / guanosine-5'-triphosphate,3'-diphosphate pyrophosphatase